jgi:hypothetical protein
MAAQAQTNTNVGTATTITLEAVDDNPVGTFWPGDYVVIQSPSLDLSGPYRVKLIQRDLKDATHVTLQLECLTQEYWQLDEVFKRMSKDVSV